MLEAGLVEEVRSLLEGGLGLDAPAFSAIGYRQVGEYLLDRCTFEEAVQKIRRATRQFVRRQANWFKEDDPEIEWYEADEGALRALTVRIKQWLEVEKGWFFQERGEGDLR
jgi:tRNA dimethylallyltransferase